MPFSTNCISLRALKASFAISSAGLEGRAGFSSSLFFFLKYINAAITAVTKIHAAGSHARNQLFISAGPFNGLISSVSLGLGFTLSTFIFISPDAISFSCLSMPLYFIFKLGIVNPPVVKVAMVYTALETILPLFVFCGISIL